MKLLYMGDRHNSPDKPLSRIDDWEQTQLKKDEEIKKIGKENKVKAILHPGDFFSKGKYDNVFLNKIINRWTDNPDKDYLLDLIKNKKFEEVNSLLNKDIPLIGIVGNHDLIGNDIGTLDKTDTGLLKNLNIFKYVTKENPIFFYTEDGLKVAITGTNYHLGVDTTKYLSDYIVEEKLGDIHIHIVHGMLSDKNMGTLIKHTTIEQIKHTKADLTLCGHDHIGFGIVELDGKYFANIGSPIRIKNDIKEIDRIPKVLLIDITSKGIALEEIILKSAPIGKDVLDRTVIEEIKEKKEQLEAYKKETKELGLLKSLNINEIINDLKDNKKIDDTIANELISLISKKEIEINKPKTLNTGTNIKKVIIENFQSHKKNVLDFSNGFNAIIGGSGEGKSSILRALKWVYKNEPTGKSFIKFGEDFSRVTVVLENGTIVIRHIEKKTNGKNTYTIITPDGKQRDGNTKLLPEVQEVLGYTDFNIDKDLNISLNFMKQGDGWFLIGDKYSGPTRAKVIGGIKGTHYADAVKRDLDKIKSQKDTIIKQNKELIKKYDDELKNFEYLSDLEKQILELELKLNKIKELKIKETELLKLKTEYNSFNEKLEIENNKINSLKNIDELLIKTLDLTNKNKEYSDLSNLNEEYVLTKKKLNSSISYIKKTDNIDDYWNKINKSKTNMNNIENLIDLNKSYKEQFKEFQIQEDIIKTTNDIDISIKSFEKIKDIHNKWINLNDINQEYKKYLNLIKENEENLVKLVNLDKLSLKNNNLKLILEKYEELVVLNKLYKEDFNKKIIQDKIILENEVKLETLIQEYQKLLEGIGVCPTCYGNLDKLRINEIVNKILK